jgi:DNA repair protein RadC
MPKIKDLPLEERPREKLLEHGAEGLSDTELLAIILRTGTRDKSALDLADELLVKFGGFKGMSGRDFEDFKMIGGLRDAKLASISATLEISRRIVRQVLKDYHII